MQGRSALILKPFSEVEKVCSIAYFLHCSIAMKYKSSQTIYKDNNHKCNNQRFMLNMWQRYLPITILSVGIDRGNVMRNTSFIAQLRFRIVWRYYSPINSTYTFSNCLWDLIRPNTLVTRYLIGCLCVLPNTDICFVYENPKMMKQQICYRWLP